MRSMFGFAFYLVLLEGVFSCFSSCQNPYKHLTDSEIRAASSQRFNMIRDTSEIEVFRVEPYAGDTWAVSYNMGTDTARVFFFRDREKAFSHRFSFLHKDVCRIEDIQFEDVTGDDHPEMLLWLYFDQGLGYQLREFLVFRDPFLAGPNTRRPVLELPVYKSWGKIERFDYFNLAKYRFRKEFDTNLYFEKEYITLEGVLGEKDRQLWVYKWTPEADTFKLSYEGALNLLHKASTVFNGSVKGVKTLRKVSSNQSVCEHLEVQDKIGRAVPVPPAVKTALTCATNVHLSPNGQFLFYYDGKCKQLSLYNFSNSQIYKIGTYKTGIDGLSAPIWQNNRLIILAVNNEEFKFKTKVISLNFSDFLVSNYDVKVSYTCNERQICAPQIGYDFWLEGRSRLYYYDYDIQEAQRRNLLTMNL